MNGINEIKEMLDAQQKLRDKVLSVIGYDSYDDSPIELNDEDEWQLDGEELYIAVENMPMEEALEEGEYYGYTVSSYSMKGEKLYTGEIDDHTIVMAYPQDEMWDDTRIYILNNTKRYTDA
ncbi:MAG: hypothetical protein M0R46_16950 [Candidatus Muirbacterium halophilum]|nr:hypothetical protein [Candidatus Muirbacterium halophilum]